MSYEFKKISDVNVIESIDDSANVLVESNGEIAKIAASNFVVNSGNSGSGSTGGSTAPVVFRVSGKINTDNLSDFVEKYFAGNIYVIDSNSSLPKYPQQIIGFFISQGNAQVQIANGMSTYNLPLETSSSAKYTSAQLTEAINNYLGE